MAPLPSTPVVGDRLGKHYFDREARLTIRLLSSLRQQVTRAGYCEVSDFEDLRSVREAVESISVKLSGLPGYGPQGPTAEQIYKDRGGHPATPKQRGRKQDLGIVSCSGSSYAEEPGGGDSQQPIEQCRTRSGSIRSTAMDADSISAGHQLFDLMRPIPGISMRELCRSRIGPASTSGCSSSGAECEALTPVPAKDHHRLPPQAPKESNSRQPGPRTAAAKRAQEALPQRPKTSMGTCSGSFLAPSPASSARDGSYQERKDSALCGELHVEAFMEVKPGESEARQACLELQICGDSVSLAPPSLWQNVVAGCSGPCGSAVLKVQNVEQAQLRAALIGGSSQESTRVALTRLLAEAQLSAPLDGPPWVPLNWPVDDRRTVHLRAFFQPCSPRNVHQPPAALPPLKSQPAPRTHGSNDHAAKLADNTTVQHEELSADQVYPVNPPDDAQLEPANGGEQASHCQGQQSASTSDTNSLVNATADQNCNMPAVAAKAQGALGALLLEHGAIH